MLLFIPRSLCALKRVAAKAEHARYGATTDIRITLASGLYRAEATDGRRAVMVQGLVPIEDPPWPGFKEVPDDACEAIVLPKDLERACKVVQSHFDTVMAHGHRSRQVQSLIRNSASARSIRSRNRPTTAGCGARKNKKERAGRQNTSGAFVSFRTRREPSSIFPGTPLHRWLISSDLPSE
jgi:hypothetical protein